MLRTLLVAVLLASLSWAQNDPAPSDAQKAEYGQTAYEDLVFITVLNDLQVTPRQADQMVAPLEKLQDELKGCDEQLQRLETAAVDALRARRDGLLAGRGVSPEQKAVLARLEEEALALADTRDAAVSRGLDHVLALLTPQQRALVADRSASPAAPNPSAPAETGAAAAPTAAQRQQAMRDQVWRLMRDARETADPRRFEQAAPQHVYNAVVSLTGLDPETPRFRQLYTVFLDRINRVYQMMPAQFAQQGPALATELTILALRAIDEASGAIAPAAARTVSPERFERAVRYGRGPILLREIAKRD